MRDKRNLVLDALRTQFAVEETRGQSLNARGANLAALGSVVLSLLTFALSTGVRGPAPASTPEAAKLMIVFALWLLVFAVAAVVVGVLRPVRPERFTGEELRRLQDAAEPEILDALITRTAEAVTRARQINRRKAKALLGAGVGVTVAVGLSAGAGTVIAL